MDYVKVPTIFWEYTTPQVHPSENWPSFISSAFLLSFLFRSPIVSHYLILYLFMYLCVDFDHGVCAGDQNKQDTIFRWIGCWSKKVQTIPSHVLVISWYSVVLSLLLSMLSHSTKLSSLLLRCAGWVDMRLNLTWNKFFHMVFFMLTL